MSKFQIDYFELMFLADACMPPAPIAKACFWDKMIDEYYHQLSWYERRHLHQYFQRNMHYKNNLIRNDIRHFDARYDPENQYIVKYYPSEEHKKSNSGILKVQQCYLWNHDYHTHINRWVRPEMIISVDKMDLSNDKFDESIFQNNKEVNFPLRNNIDKSNISGL